MTGILERIENKLDTLAAQLAPAQQPLPPQFAPPPIVAAQPPAVAQLGVGAGQYPPASAEMITALITPYVEQPHVKAAFQQQMQAMGIAALPDARPDQYGELYARFQQVVAQASAQQPQPAAMPASII